MVRKGALLLFAVFVVAGTVIAQSAPDYRYIVTVTGNVESTGGIFYSYTRIINVSAKPASITFDLFPADAKARCNDTPQTLQPGAFTALGGRCQGVFSAMIHSDQPLYVRSEVLSYSRERFLAGPDEEPIPVATSFIGADQVALIPDVHTGGPMASRANMAIVNPSSRPLNAKIFGYGSLGGQKVVTLAPKSLLLVPVTDLVVAGDPISGARHFLVTADGPFQAGASSVRDDGSAQYRAAFALDQTHPPQ